MNAPRHDPNKLQLPIEAIAIFLNLARNTMLKNEGIIADDWKWYRECLKEMLQEAEGK